MFNSITDAKTYLSNSGWIDHIDLDRASEIAENLYRNATDESSANAIIESYLI